MNVPWSVLWVDERECGALWNDVYGVKLMYWKENVSQYGIFDYNCHIDYPGIQPGHL